jgi:hypothetical protein
MLIVNTTSTERSCRVRHQLQAPSSPEALLLDRDYMQNLTVQAGNSGLVVGTPGDPRTWGMTLRAHW